MQQPAREYRESEASYSCGTIYQDSWEARFLRAYYFGLLISHFWDVPLVDKTLPPAESFMPRTPKAQVFDFVMRKLDSAAAKLPVSYTGLDVGRATMGSALAYKARIALYNENWDVAAAAGSHDYVNRPLVFTAVAGAETTAR